MSKASEGAETLDPVSILENAPGMQLRDARETAELSQQIVADALNLPIQVIHRLEGDLYAELDSPVFSIGYLRAYAKYLDLDANSLVAQVQAMQETKGDSALVAHSVPVFERLKDVGRSPIFLPGLVLCLCIVVVSLVWWFAGGSEAETLDPQEKNQTMQPGPDADTDSNKDLLAGQESKMASRSVAEAIETNAPPTAVSFEKTAAGSQEESVVIAQLSAAQNVPTASNLITSAGIAGQSTQRSAAKRSTSVVYENGARRLTSLGDDVIEFGFTNESWVSVKTLDRVELYSDLSKAGTSLKLKGQGPFRILVGFAPGVVLTVNRERIELGTYTRDNVARVVVGR
ncbi:MAG: DUF4115 domain-containing protein [Pseudomonadales bacterium]|nr:DUF4115 domain-containing protein [Pseudomonadales bacterium]